MKRKTKPVRTKRNELAVLFFLLVPLQFFFHELTHVLLHTFFGGNAILGLTQTIFLTTLSSDKSFLVTLAGPLFNWVVAIIGICIIRRYLYAGLFLTLFVVRHIMMACFFLLGSPSSDEIKLALALNLQPWVIIIPSGIIACLCLVYAYRYFQQIPCKKSVGLAILCGLIVTLLV